MLVPFSIPASSYRQALIYVRGRLGVSPQVMAQLLMTPRQTYAQWESGSRRTPGVAVAAAQGLLNDRIITARRRAAQKVGVSFETYLGYVAEGKKHCSGCDRWLSYGDFYGASDPRIPRLPDAPRATWRCKACVSAAGVGRKRPPKVAKIKPPKVGKVNRRSTSRHRERNAAIVSACAQTHETMGDVAQRYNISKSRVSQIVIAARMTAQEKEKP